MSVYMSVGGCVSVCVCVCVFLCMGVCDCVCVRVCVRVSCARVCTLGARGAGGGGGQKHASPIIQLAVTRTEASPQLKAAVPQRLVIGAAERRRPRASRAGADDADGGAGSPADCENP
ncbi:hypothetical protein EVAR_67473_1 [Eumeta japonica]|uniref:Secreted protein n=1 Tax=Eumeta variegata TaxID=151549 RepID=A0A4C1ZCX9_EUMVA|nr:hypothetical protein EVAR_67473_1 [Eumeta japonica]